MSGIKGYIFGLATVPVIRASSKYVKKVRKINKERDREDEILRRLQYHFDCQPGFDELMWDTDREIYWFLKHRQNR